MTWDYANACRCVLIWKACLCGFPHTSTYVRCVCSCLVPISLYDSELTLTDLSWLPCEDETPLQSRGFSFQHHCCVHHSGIVLHILCSLSFNVTVKLLYQHASFLWGMFTMPGVINLHQAETADISLIVAVNG